MCSLAPGRLVLSSRSSGCHHEVTDHKKSNMTGQCNLQCRDSLQLRRQSFTVQLLTLFDRTHAHTQNTHRHERTHTHNTHTHTHPRTHCTFARPALIRTQSQPNPAWRTARSAASSAPPHRSSVSAKRTKRTSVHQRIFERMVQLGPLATGMRKPGNPGSGAMF